MVTLAFDTSAAHCSAALLLGGGKCFLRHEKMQKGQAENLLPMIQSLLEQSKTSFSDISTIGVGVGPGNFTGVRISVSLARGLALGLGVRSLGVNVFDALSYEMGACAVIEDARRDAFYVQLFDGQRGSNACICSLDDAALLVSGLPLLGSGAAVVAQKTQAKVCEPKFPLAQSIALLTQQRAKERFVKRAAPFYLRAADATIAPESPVVILDD